MVHSSDITACFSEDYAKARSRFLSACNRVGANVRAYANPARGPRAEELITDVAWVGPKNAQSVLITISATHGVEGFCGSAAQSDWLTLGGPGRLPDGTAALLIHAMNPYGFAWLRRVNEDGVDLNRNHIDFSQPLPANSGYEELADAFVPREITGPIFEAAEAKLAAWRAKHGEQAYRLARSGGQYAHPGGHCYGGTKPTWSRLTTEAIIADHAIAGRDVVAVIDFHSGLGPFGYGEPICGHSPDALALKRARAWYGDSVTSPALGTSSSVPLTGHTRDTWVRLLGERVVFITLEFGTYSQDRTLNAMRGDYWLHNRGGVDWNAAERAASRRAFASISFPIPKTGRKWCCSAAVRFCAKPRPAWRKSKLAAFPCPRPVLSSGALWLDRKDCLGTGRNSHPSSQTDASRRGQLSEAKLTFVYFRRTAEPDPFRT